MIVRAETASDHAGVRAVNVLAFGRPDEADLVDRLRGPLVVASRVAVHEERIVGHILFTRLTLHTPNDVLNAVALAPLAVLPDWQRRQVGSTLVRDGIWVLREAGEQVVIVVGHPEYYPRFGFSADLASNLRGPFSGRAFMALELQPDALHRVCGEVRYPPAFSLP